MMFLCGKTDPLQEQMIIYLLKDDAVMSCLPSTCVFGLESVGGAAALGRTAAEVATAADPFPTVAMIWPWVLRSSCGATVCTWRPWRGRVGVAAPPAKEAGFTSSGRVPITCGETVKSFEISKCYYKEDRRCKKMNHNNVNIKY